MDKETVNFKKPKEILNDIYVASFIANAKYPQMQAPILIAFGVGLLEQRIHNNICLYDYKKYLPDKTFLSDFSLKVGKLHATFGGNGEIMNSVSVSKMESMYTRSKIDLDALLFVLFGTKEWNDSDRIQSVFRLFKSGNEVLKSKEWQGESIVYRESFRPILKKGPRGISGSQMSHLRDVWERFSNGLRENVLSAMDLEFNNLSDIIQIHPDNFKLFKTELSKYFLVEVHERTKDIQYPD